jgi:hypothetical protein
MLPKFQEVESGSRQAKSEFKDRHQCASACNLPISYKLFTLLFPDVSQNQHHTAEPTPEYKFEGMRAMVLISFRYLPKVADCRRRFYGGSILCKARS